MEKRSSRRIYRKKALLLFFILLIQFPFVGLYGGFFVFGQGIPNKGEEKEPSSSSFFKDIGERISVNGYLKNESSFRFTDPQGFDKILNIFHFEGRYSIASHFQLTGIIQGYYDAVFDFEDIDTISPRLGPITILTENPEVEQIPGLEVENVRGVEIKQTDLDLREFFLDARFADLDLRLGRQIVRWGIAEGARVTDEINPLDFKEFILRDVSDRYIPLWMLKADYYYEDTEWEVLWIPHLSFHKPAPRSSEWEQFQFLPGREVPDSEFSLLGTPLSIKNSEYALKWTTPLMGWEVSLSYFYTWDDFATTFRETIQTQTITGTQTEVKFNQRYTRNHIVGGTFQRSLGPVVLGGEAAYVFNKHFGAGFIPFFGSPIVGGGGGVRPGTVVVIGGDALGDRGVVVRDFLKYAIQFDFSLFGADVSFQSLQHYIPKYDNAIIQDKVDTVLSLFARRVLANNLLSLQILTIYFINDQEVLIRPRMDYHIDDHLQLAFGFDILLGEQTGSRDPFIPGDFNFVGFFKNNSRLYLELKYGF